MISNALTVLARIKVLSPKQSSTKESSVIRRQSMCLQKLTMLKTRIWSLHRVGVVPDFFGF